MFEALAGPLAQPHTPGVSYRRWRTVAFDGCGSIKVPDQERNRGWLGRASNRLGWAGYPTVQLMTLCEMGTRGLLGAVFGPRRHHETREIAESLGYSNIKSLRTGLARWATEGLLHKISNGVYTLAAPAPQPA